MTHFLKSLRGDDRGAAIIELGIVAPILALITVGVVDMANGFATKLKLEQASQRAIEKIMMSFEGDLTVFEIAEAVGLDYQIVREYVEKFKEKGLVEAKPV